MVSSPDSNTTHNCHRKLFSSILVVCLLASFSLFGINKSGPLSRERLQVLRRLVQEYFQVEENIEVSDYRAVKIIGEAFVEAQGDCPLVPSSRRPYDASDCRRAAKKRTKELVDSRYPPLDKTELEKEAAEKYPIYEKGDLVTVWYSLNPVRPSKVTGVYRNRTTGSIQVGRHVILISDMAALNRNEKELLKFDPDASNELRNQYVNEKLTAYEETKKLYMEKVAKLSMEAEESWAIGENEKMGFVFYGGKWQSIRDIVGTLVIEERERVKRERRIAAEQRMKRKYTRVISSMRSQTAVFAATSGLEYISPEKALEERDALRKKLEEEQTKAQAEAAEAESEATAQAGGTETVETSAAGKKPGNAETGTGEISTKIGGSEEVGIFGLSEEDSDALVRYGMYGIAGLVVLVIGGLGVNAFLKYMRDPSRFFKGRGSLQKRFWASAEADPDNFKYVAYRFSNITEARDALLNLSYITENSSGHLRCRREILFGFYPHQDKFVTFVGGTELCYAMWREASAVLPELPNAEYFRVSTAPNVKLELPNLDELLTESGLKITHVEDREGVGDDYGHYFVYHADDKETALEFLQLARVEEAGAHVIVETPDGTWGKDTNGIYQEGDADGEAAGEGDEPAGNDDETEIRAVDKEIS